MASGKLHGGNTAPPIMRKLEIPTFHAKMGSIKDRNGMDLTEAEDIKKRWQEYTEELYKNEITTQITTMM